MTKRAQDPYDESARPIPIQRPTPEEETAYDPGPNDPTVAHRRPSADSPFAPQPGANDPTVAHGGAPSDSPFAPQPGANDPTVLAQRPGPGSDDPTVAQRGAPSNSPFAPQPGANDPTIAAQHPGTPTRPAHQAAPGAGDRATAHGRAPSDSPFARQPDAHGPQTPHRGEPGDSPFAQEPGANDPTVAVDRRVYDDSVQGTAAAWQDEVTVIADAAATGTSGAAAGTGTSGSPGAAGIPGTSGPGTQGAPVGTAHQAVPGEHGSPRATAYSGPGSNDPTVEHPVQLPAVQEAGAEQSDLQDAGMQLPDLQQAGAQPTGLEHTGAQPAGLEQAGAEQVGGQRPGGQESVERESGEQESVEQGGGRGGGGWLPDGQMTGIADLELTAEQPAWGSTQSSYQEYGARLAELTEVRVRHPERVAEAWQQRRTRALVGDDGRLLIVAADHPARGALGVRGDRMAMGSRPELIGRLMTALARPGVDGVLATPDILEDLLLLGALEGKVVIGSMNRGGLQGAAFEVDDRFTAYRTADEIAARRLDGGKMLTRIDLGDPGTVTTLESSAVAVTGLAEHKLMAMVEPFWSTRTEGGRVTNLLDPDSVIKSIHIASALGATSAYTWLKLPVVDELERVMEATTLPTLLLGGDPTVAPEATYASWGKALSLPSVRGLVVGRALLFPPDGDVAAAVDHAAMLVHGGAA